MKRSVFLAGAILFALGLSPAQQPDPAQSGAIIRTETRLVVVDTVVTDKKGAYVRDLTVKDFKVWEDKKEQKITTFSFEADPSGTANSQKRYIVLFFDNSTMGFGEQAQARQAAAKFIESNTGPNRMMSIVNFGGSLQVAQNFTDDAERLKAVVTGAKTSAVSPNMNASLGNSQLNRAAADFGARDMIMSLRSLAKNLSTVPGRKTLILFTSGFPVTPEQMSEVTATIDACNKSNVAIYPIDVRGLVTPSMGGPPKAELRPAIIIPGAMGFLPQATGGGQAGGGGRGAGGGTGAPTGGGTGGRGSTGGTGSGGTVGNGGGRVGSGNPGGSTGRGGGAPVSFTNPNQRVNPLFVPRNIIPKFPESSTTNQQLMFMLADGTGGFVIHDTNDLLGGLEKIGKELNEYYVLGYTPDESEEGSCHTLHVKVDRGGTNVRARTGYCNAKPRDLLAGNSIEKQLETRASAAQAGNVAASMQAPFFYTSENVARVNVAMEITPDTLKFEKAKGKFHSAVNVLGIAYTPDGGVGARFSDTVKLDFENKKEVEAFQEQPFHYENQFDVASGKYNLKVVFSSGSEGFGKLEAPLVVDSYDAKQFSMSALAFSKETHKAADLGTGLDAALIEDRTPLIVQGLQVIPAGTNHFKKTDSVVTYLEIYEPLLVLPPDPQKPVAVALQIRVLDAKTGDAKVDSGLFRIPLPEKSGNPVVPHGLKLPVGQLAPGSYRLEVTAVDGIAKSVTRTGDFQIE